MDSLFDTAVQLGDIVAIYLLFRLKLLMADYFLQTSWMARGKGKLDRWALPLFAHAGVHASGTLLIALTVAPRFWWLGLVDLTVHASIDRVKAAPALGGRWQPGEPAFWWAHGMDQEAHNLTHLAFVVILVLA